MIIFKGAMLSTLNRAFDPKKLSKRKQRFGSNKLAFNYV